MSSYPRSGYGAMNGVGSGGGSGGGRFGSGASSKDPHALQPRLEWVATRISLAFDVPPTAAKALIQSDLAAAAARAKAKSYASSGVQSPSLAGTAHGSGSAAQNGAGAAMEDEAVASLHDLLQGEGPSTIFVFYQPYDPELPHVGPASSPRGSTSELFFTFGHQERLASKCMYLLRTADGPVDLGVASDSKLLSGELCPPAALLGSLSLFVSKVAQPQIAWKRDWGDAPSDTAEEFVAGLETFSKSVDESIHGMGGGLVLLTKPDGRFDLDAIARDVNAGAVDPDVAKHFEGLLEGWCARISKSLNEPIQALSPTNRSHPSRRGSVGASTAGFVGHEGPQTVISYWRRRMQRLTSVTEQLKRKEFGIVIRVLQTAVKMDRGLEEAWKASVFSLLRRWKQIDVDITEAAVEAKDNVKYLGTLESFLEPLYNGTPVTITDTLPALLNGIRMVYTIARYFNTAERMEDLLSKVADQLIVACRKHVLAVDDDTTRNNLWKKNPEMLCVALTDCLNLRAAFEDQYRFTQDQLKSAAPRGKLFDFNERAIFGRFDMFCRRVQKLIEMFSTIQQFKLLSQQQLEGMETQVSTFFQLTKELRRKRHDLLDYERNDFDRDYVEFNARILELELELQEFIHASFEGISSIEQSLALLNKFKTILQRETLRADLDDKFVAVFQSYGQEIELVNSLFERSKHQPPVPRNLPPVAGNIMWARHLMKRISAPMKQFEAQPSVLAHKEAQRIVKMYNKVAKKLVGYECLWHMAWVESVDASKLAGLQATLLIRHPDDGKLYVNFDHEIWQVIREARCLDRMGNVEIPEHVKIVLLQESKFKRYYDDLTWLLREYARVSSKIIPVTAALLRPLLADVEYKLRPGMITLTWSSMNIDAYKHTIQVVIKKLEELVNNVNDIIENRIEKNLKIVSKAVLINMPGDTTFSISNLVGDQQSYIDAQAELLQAKNVEIELAVEDLLALITSYPLDEDLFSVSKADVTALRQHYNHFMYQALLNTSRNSLALLKRRIGASAGRGLFFGDSPFFKLTVQLSIPDIVVSPALGEVQAAVNEVAKAVVSFSRHLWDWGQEGVPVLRRRSFFDRITQDIEIVRLVLLLTGSMHGTKKMVAEYLSSLRRFAWLWEEDADAIFQKFIKNKPEVDDYELELQRFQHVEQHIESIPAIHGIGPLALETDKLREQLKRQTHMWRAQYSDNLHKMAQGLMAELHDYMKSSVARLQRPVVDIDSLRFVMDVLMEVRAKESGIDHEINPVLDMYQMLERYLPSGYMDKHEMDQKSILRASWRRLLQVAEEVTDRIANLQIGFKKELLSDIRTFVEDVVSFRADYLANGPMVQGISPQDAMDRLRRYHDEFELLERRQNLYNGGQQLFAMQRTKYPELEATRREFHLLDTLYTLYREVMAKEAKWKTILWSEVVANVAQMSKEMEAFHLRCRKMPAPLRTWNAYEVLKKKIEDYVTVLPLLVEMSKPSIRDRHWEQVEKLTGRQLDVRDPEFKLQDLLEADLVGHHASLEEIADGADKELSIESKLSELQDRWQNECFHFSDWRGGVSILMGVAMLLEDLEEAQLNLQTMLTMRHITPFKSGAQGLLTALSNSSETLELWSKVQTLWCSLESVFLGGDIARQMPAVSRRFTKIDKDWVRMMKKACSTELVLECCSNEVLRASLPVMFSELEKCQKNLEGYLEQKRNKFPRFYFVSDPVLLQILSQGSNPMAVQPYYEKIFDSISGVEHHPTDVTIIKEFINRDSAAEERIGFASPVSATGNIEDWLMSLLLEMQRTMKLLCEECAFDVRVVSNFVEQLREFVDQYCAQYALLGIQFMWTADVQSALESCRTKRNAMKDLGTKTNNVLRELSSWCLQDLGSQMNRKKIETLVTVQVHQRDVVEDLTKHYKAKTLTSAEDFEWLKQSRFFWHPDDADFVSNEGACRVSVTDVNFDYQYEYLGTKERLVITPLTDRCYITLAQAVGMFYGGAPAGPAGTGKTETTKDMGRAMGIFVVVTNCTPEMRYTDCAKIFKGLCQSGLWGCFDEFNRIELPVLSVVAQQVLAVNNAKKNSDKTFQFPGDTDQVILNPNCGFFITLNPPVKGYGGRQQLPENLKALFRGVAMMVPDFDIIIKVKLCSVGYATFPHLAKKFQICYALCKEQLSAQRHYDFGLRNILSVLRTAGQTKRDNLDKDEEELLYRTLRDMNLSKLVAQDVPLFLSMLKDVFPSVPAPRSSHHGPLTDAVHEAARAAGLTLHDDWLLKVIQLYETQLVRHGIMLTGPTGGGKSKIFEVLQGALSIVTEMPHRTARMNPKAFRVQDMYGETDLLTGEWTQGVFSALWEKYNNRNNAYVTWIICDGPVDTIWVESMNTVLDDNKMLTLASGDRIPMTDNTKLMFENEHLDNASPATVSRTGIVYVSEADLGWSPVAQAWIRTLPSDWQDVVSAIFRRHLGESRGVESGHLFDFLAQQVESVMTLPRVAALSSCLRLLQSLLNEAEPVLAPPTEPSFALQVERLFLYALSWSVGGVLDTEDRVKWDSYLRRRGDAAMPAVRTAGETVYEYHVDTKTLLWVKWVAPKWVYPKQAETLDFSNLLVPTLDSTRAIALLDRMHKQKLPVLMVGAQGTAKTSSGLMYFDTFDSAKRVIKRFNFSSATSPHMFQVAIESDLDKRGGRSFGPPNGKNMTVFLDDLSMPEINKWGDQPTNELVRQLIEQSGFYFLEKDKRGDFKHCEDLQYVAAMTQPGGGRNDIPSRLKRQFFTFAMVLPELSSIDDIYGQMLRGRFSVPSVQPALMDTVNRLTHATIELWRVVKARMLPTPSKFHYVFNMRDLSRVFQGILRTPLETILSGGSQSISMTQPSVTLLQLWKHECSRVFQDKLVCKEDKDWFSMVMGGVVETHFGVDLVEACRRECFFVDFFRDDVYDEDGVFLAPAPKIYEPGGTLRNIRDRVHTFLELHNEDHPSAKLELVMFDDALRHLMRIARIISMPRGSALLVGVGGSGKQSLTRLAAYMARSTVFTLSLTKTYNVQALLEDLRDLYRAAGKNRTSTTFLLTDAEIKDESFLEYINSVLITGEIAGLFAKDEMMALCGDIRTHFQRARPGVVDSPDNLKRFFIDTVRDNLHVVLCMSPVDPRFSTRARKFPGIISSPTIDWFLPWPTEALVSVARGLLSNFPMEIEDDVKYQLTEYVATVHKTVVDVCMRFYTSMRRHVSQTPKSYLSFIRSFLELYSKKLGEIEEQEARVHLGLEKLQKGAEDVERMKLILADERVKLERATEETNTMLGSLEISSLEAEKEAAKVEKINQSCQAEANRIRSERDLCEDDLAKAQPFLDEANHAISSIQPAHIFEMRTMKKPSDIVRIVCDGVLILLGSKMVPVTPGTVTVNRRSLEFVTPSWQSALLTMADTSFLKRVQTFEKDKVNEETIELLLPYMELEDFNPKVARLASVAAEGLCTWVRAMKFYHEASKIVKPKLEALVLAEARMEEAYAALASAQQRLKKCNDRMASLRRAFDEQMARKQAIADNAVSLQVQMEQAQALIQGLSGERTRWRDDSNTFADKKRRLVGDCAIACAFISYCGPFNQPFRQHLLSERFMRDCQKRDIPCTADLDVSQFLVDIGTIGDWNLEGLPTDPLSIQNGVLVTQASRYPLLIDPQGQALTWIKAREERKLPLFGVTPLSHRDLRDRVEFCMQEGLTLLVTGVNEELDPLLDPVLEKRTVQRGFRRYIDMSGKNVELVDSFRMYFITRLSNPHFSPELQAKTTVVDFTVTQQGLEEQLLGKVIAREQRALEDLLTQVLEDVNVNTKALIQLDATLLSRLTENEGLLLDDRDLIGVLANTKAKAAAVKEKLVKADETRRSINEKREQFRPVATRGSVLYFSIVDLSMVNPMYQTSLAQFTELFLKSMEIAEKPSLASKRVSKIIEAMTYLVYRYVNKGLYDKHKLLFVFIMTVKIAMTAGLLEQSELNLFLRAGAALEVGTVRARPSWMLDEAWLNAVALSENAFFKALPDNILRNEALWRRWYEDNEPDTLPIPDFEMSISDNAETGPWLRLLLVRCLRPDRTLLTMKNYIRNTEGMGDRYISPVTDTVEMVFSEMTPTSPALFLLSVGADPTNSIENLARKLKTACHCVSMGEGQEPVALKAIQAAAVTGGWILLQNCELGLPLMEQLEELLISLRETANEAFRLFLTAMPHPKFPLGLLQMCTKVCDEPPAGLKAGLLRSYNVVIDQDKIERIDADEWRFLVFSLSFLHSIAQERRKFGALGWCQMYDFNNGDLSACISFLEKHMYAGPISWPTVHYMVAQVQYGGKITDTMDRRLFSSYASAWLTPNVVEPSFVFNPPDAGFLSPEAFARLSRDFVYTNPDTLDIEAYRRHISEFPDIDSPEAFGLHPNADLTYRVKEVDALLSTLSETMPRQTDGTGTNALEDFATEKARELYSKLPDDYVEEEYKARIRRLGGMDVPLNIFLFQEVQRFQKVVHKVRTTLQAMQQAIRGEVVMTTELLQSMNDIYDAKVPESWVWTPNADELSWILPTLGMWFSSLLDRDRQLRTWLSSGRPSAFWLTGFFNPQGFLTAMKQEVTRAHKKDNWALNDVVYATEVTDFDRVEQIPRGAKNGVYIYGLFLDAAAWSKGDRSLVESDPKRLFAPMPPIYVTAMTSAMYEAKLAAYDEQGLYECPVYKYPDRTDRYLIFSVYIPTRTKPAVHWIFRGVALLCSTL